MAHVGSWELRVDDPSNPLKGPLHCSDEVFRIFGYEPNEVEPTFGLFLERVHPEDRERVDVEGTQALVEGRPLAIEHRIIRPDGTERVVFVWDEIIRDASGQIIGMVGTCQDITERKRSEWALQQYTNRLEYLREIDRAILTSRSPREIARAALGQLRQLVPYWTGLVAAYNLDREETEVLAGEGILEERYPPGARFDHNLSTSPELRAVRAGQVVTREDMEQTPLTNPEMETLWTAGMRSYVLLPLLDQRGGVGILFLASDHPSAFSREHLEVLGEVADHLVPPPAIEDWNSMKVELRS
jgi:PAS domain S-box-containing protein